MNISNEEAIESLAQVEDIMTKTRKSLVSAYAGSFLILWGIIWIISYIGTHFFLIWTSWIWNITGVIGVIGTIIIIRRLYGKGPARRNSSRGFVLRTILFWPFVFAYASVWISILKPHNGIEFNSFMVTVVMFAYVIMGLWFESWLMSILGIVITAFTLVGVHVIPVDYYSLYMAVTAGGGLLGTGLYMKFRWR